MLLLNINGDINNSEKNIESCGMISHDIATQSLESSATDKVKIFNQKNHSNLSDQNILDVCKDEHYEGTTEEEFMKSSCALHVFQENNTIFTNQNSKKDAQHNVINVVDAALQNGVHSNKRHAVSWEEMQFYMRK